MTDAIHYPVLQTPRLVLRYPRVEDSAAVFGGYASDPEVTRYMVWKPNESLEQTEQFMRARVEANVRGQSFAWALTRRGGDDTLIGMIELRPNDFKADVGYVLSRPHWGKGLMTEALCAVMDFAFSLPGIYRVWATCDVDNIGSARVMEKAGMLYEGTLRRNIIHPNISDEPRDVRCYAKTR
jgi:ribosomal-protein-alanine N-acetyltransferase